MLCRERRSWTAKEDQLLREAVQREDPENPNPSKWHAIAKHVPNRTNKDCRKRWFAKMASDVVKGGWAPDEDEKLVKGIERFGTRWSLVASVVQTRNSDQCAKRWTDTLNPAIDRTTWSPEADELLLQAVNEHGKVWTKIVKTYFPGRTGLSAKNRYNSITRFSADSSRNVRPRRKSPESGLYSMDRKSESVSSSSSASPATPSLPLPLNQSFTESAHLSYNFDSLPGWSPTSSNSADDISPYIPSPAGFELIGDGQLSSPSTPSTDGSYQSFEFSMNQTLSAFPDESHIVYADTTAMPTDAVYFEHFMNKSHVNDQAGIYPSPSQDLYPAYSQFPGVYGSNDMTNQFPLFDTIPSQVDPLISMAWDNTDNPKPYNGFKMQASNDYPYAY